MSINAKSASTNETRGVIERYRAFLPVSETTPIISLGEGNTPLVYAAKLSARIGNGCAVYIKNEGLNPTGSFKDRGMTVAVSKAVENRARALICASTGNTSASAAAYAAKAGIPCAVILPAVEIGRNAVISAGAVVRDAVADHCLVTGNPAQVVKTDYAGYRNLSV